MGIALSGRAGVPDRVLETQTDGEEMSAFSLSPFEMKVLLHYHVSPLAFRSNATQELVNTSHMTLTNAGLLNYGMNTPHGYEISEKGRSWLHRALSTPLPVQKWVWESQPLDGGVQIGSPGNSIGSPVTL